LLQTELFEVGSSYHVDQLNGRLRLSSDTDDVSLFLKVN